MRTVIAGLAASLVLGAGAVVVLADGDAAPPSRLPQAVVTAERYHDSGEQRPEDEKPRPTPTPTPTASPVVP